MAETQKLNSAKLNLLPNEPIESFWDALWLGIQPFLCFYGAKLNSAKLNLLPHEPIESFCGTVWLGIRPLLHVCCTKKHKHISCRIEFATE